MSSGKRIALFDVDGTLSKPRGKATEEMLAFMQQLRKVRVRRGEGGGVWERSRRRCCSVQQHRWTGRHARTRDS